MKKQNKKKVPDDFMRKEYDFDYSKGEKGRYAKKSSKDKKLDFSKWIVLDHEPGDDKYDREFIYSDTERGT
ncbi:MAG: hypothetical protein M1419_05655 [Bacteroidetes bacterium]|nr:hypothetical protein [Bacteroidota bacterium]